MALIMEEMLDSRDHTWHPLQSAFGAPPPPVLLRLHPSSNLSFGALELWAVSKLSQKVMPYMQVPRKEEGLIFQNISDPLTLSPTQHNPLSTEGRLTLGLSVLLSALARDTAGWKKPWMARSLKDLVIHSSHCYSSPQLQLPRFKVIFILQIHKLALGLLSQPH